jgi:nucleoside-diphosphate-sugar epimerase
VTDEQQLDEALSRPTAADVAAMAALPPGDVLILGASGKMGPSLARVAVRASRQAGTPRRIIGVARFSAAGARAALERDGIEVVVADLLERDALARLPECPHVVFMVGQKFGTAQDHALTWATNVLAAALAAERFASGRIVAFSTGNVYPLTSATEGGPREADPVGPVGEYAQSALARERVLEFCARRAGTPMAILRLNYAVEPRYGVLRDVADRVLRGEPIDLAMGHVNVIWQRDACAIALRALAHCAVPPFVLNLTGTETVSVRALAERFGAIFRVQPRFTGTESGTALLSNAALCRRLFGPAETPLERMIELVADWVKRGGRGLGKPTRFEEREGRF